MALWDDVISREEQLQYRKAGWGGRVGFGSRPAVIIVDMNNAFVDPRYPFSSPPAQATVPYIGKLLDVCRGNEIPIFYTTGTQMHTQVERGRWKSAGIADPLMEDENAQRIYPALAPLPHEVVLKKHYPSAFFGTSLVSYLIYLSIDTLIVTGTVTSGCVRGTCLDAFSYNFRVIVPEECVCDRGDVSHKVALFEIHMKYGDVIPLAEVIGHLEKESVSNSEGRNS